MAIEIQPHEVYVYNYRLDGYGHVNNARYLEFLEEARWDFFRQWQMLAQLRETQLVVSQINIQYRAAAQLDDVLHIHSQLLSAQSRQVQLAQQIVRTSDNKLLAQAHITLMPTQHGKIIRLPEIVLQQLQTIAQSANHPIK